MKYTAAILAIALTTAYAAADDIMRISYKNGRAAKYKVESIANMRFETRTFIDGHECVDLGLPSGVLWATCNIGANSPEKYGDCFAWGETSTKSTYDIFKSNFAKKLHSWMLENEVIDLSDNLKYDYDAARAKWGGAWRMPTDAEFQELKDNCTFTDTILDRTHGCVITGPNGKSIFMPAAGNYHGFQGEHGRYWSATSFTEDDRAMAFYFDENTCYNTKELFGTGLPVRPVIFENDVNTLPIVTNVAGTFENETISLNWDAVDNATSYAVYRSAEGNTYTLIGESTDNSYVDNTPLVGDNFYRIQAWGADDTRSTLSSPSKPVIATGIAADGINHEWVDLGLPSGTKWATCNLGADNAAGYGDYYSWGSTETQPIYSGSNYPWRNMYINDLTERGVIDNNHNLTPQYDAATVHWGDNWRMPTAEEVNELIDNCAYEWTTFDGHFGAIFTGPNGNTIYFPASGYRADSEFERTIYRGVYWSATQSTNDNRTACILNFIEGYPGAVTDDNFKGATIRPIYKPSEE